MDLEFRDGDLEACAKETKLAVRRWGADVGDKYVQRLVILNNAPDFQSLYQLRFLRLHKLEGDRRDFYALTLHGRWRLLVSLLGEKRVRIEEVSNHYGD